MHRSGASYRLGRNPRGGVRGAVRPTNLMLHVIAVAALFLGCGQPSQSAGPPAQSQPAPASVSQAQGIPSPAPTTAPVLGVTTGPYRFIPMAVSTSSSGRCCGLTAQPSTGWTYAIVTFSMENTSKQLAFPPAIVRGTLVDSGGNNRDFYAASLAPPSNVRNVPLLPGQRIKVTGAAYMPQAFQPTRLTLKIEHLGNWGERDFPTQTFTADIPLDKLTPELTFPFASHDPARPTLKEPQCFEYGNDRSWCVRGISLSEQEGTVSASVDLSVKNLGGNNINVSSFSSHTPVLALFDDAGEYLAHERPTVKGGCLEFNSACLAPGMEDARIANYEYMLPGPLNPARKVWAMVGVFGKDRQALDQRGQRYMLTPQWAVRQVLG